MIEETIIDETIIDGFSIEGFSRNGKTLLSGIDPAGRAVRIAKAIPVSDRTLYLCPSPLFGYGLECLLARIAHFPHSAVLCVELDPELFSLSQRHFGAELKGSGQLRLTNHGEAVPLCALLRREWGPRFFRRLEMIRLNGGWQLHAGAYQKIAETLRREIALDWGNAMTLTKLGRRYIRNALRNLLLIPHCPPLARLSFGEDPVLVLGAGPSLDRALDGLEARFAESLKEPRDRPFRIVCVDTCLPSLRDRGITADLAVILESQHWNLDDFVGLAGWNVPIAFDLSALPRTADILSGGRYLFFTPWTNLNIFERLETAGLLPDTLPALGSVGLSAAFIARRLTKGKIIFAGLDFSFTVDSFHARSTPGHKKSLRRQYRLASPLNAEAAFDGAVFTAISKTGGKVLSNPALRHYRDLFEREFGDGESGNSRGNCRLFDIADSGLPLGIKTLSPVAAFDLLAETHPDISNKQVPHSPFPIPHFDEKICLFIGDEIIRLKKLKDMLTGESPMDSGALAALIDECDYLWAHFPDYAASVRRPGKAELEAGGDTIISFLKRLRVEIDPFITLWESRLVQ